MAIMAQLGRFRTVDGERRRAEVAGLIACSPPRQFYRARAVEQPDFPERMAQAEALVEAGRGEEHLWAPTSGSVGIFTARTYVSKYGRHERNDVRPHAAHLGCPLLAVAGGAEAEAFHLHARELAECAGGAWHIIDGADHYYRGRLPVLLDLVVGWLERHVLASLPSPLMKG